MRNQYRQRCKDCLDWVEVGEGYFEKQRGGGWAARHVLCTAKAKVAAGAEWRSLSRAQQQAIQQSAQDPQP